MTTSLKCYLDRINHKQKILIKRCFSKIIFHRRRWLINTDYGIKLYVILSGLGTCVVITCVLALHGRTYW